MHLLIERLRNDIDATLCPLDAAAMQQRPSDDADRWTIQQTIEHLLLTYSLSAGAIEERLAKGRPTHARPSVGQSAGQFILLRLGCFPRGRESPAMAMPAVSAEPRSGSQLAGSVRELLARFDAAAGEAERLFGTRRAISHPVLGPLSAWQWRKFHLVHGRHHLRLIRAMEASRRLNRG